MTESSAQQVAGSDVRGVRSRPVLRVEGVAASWGSNPVLAELSMGIGPGERVALLGPNGAGKSTLFDVITGRLELTAGSLWLGGEDVAGRAVHQRALLGLGYVPQEPCVFAELKVRDHLIAAARSPVARRRGLDARLAGAAAIDEALTAWSLQGLSQRRAGTLSGGERRRLEVCMALTLSPRLLILDEPFTGLDPQARRLLRQGLSSLRPATALLVSDHRADDVLKVCERVAVLVDGRLAFDGPASDFSPRAAAYRRYFGLDEEADSR